mgnify:CR=1 FL=1
MKQYDIGDKILTRLKRVGRIEVNEFIALFVNKRFKDPFIVLIATIISQNTNEKNTFKAFESLRRKIGELKPERLADMSLDEIVDAIRVSGMYRVKSRAIKEVSKLILKEFKGNTEALRNLSIDEAYSILLQVPGVGKKTVDVMLAYMGKPVLPVDTHIRRIAKRLGVTTSNNYEDIKESLENIFRPELRLKAHLYLIKLGRSICKASKPLCLKCPLNDICKEGQKNLPKGS